LRARKKLRKQIIGGRGGVELKKKKKKCRFLKANPFMACRGGKGGFKRVKNTAKRSVTRTREPGCVEISEWRGTRGLGGTKDDVSSVPPWRGEKS